MADSKHGGTPPDGTQSPAALALLREIPLATEGAHGDGHNYLEADLSERVRSLVHGTSASEERRPRVVARDLTLRSVSDPEEGLSTITLTMPGRLGGGLSKTQLYALVPIQDLVSGTPAPTPEPTGPVTAEQIRRWREDTSLWADDAALARALNALASAPPPVLRISRDELDDLCQRLLDAIWDGCAIDVKDTADALRTVLNRPGEPVRVEIEEVGG